MLGLIFDPMHRFVKHASAVQDKVRKRNNTLNFLAGSTWGKDKQLLVATYEATCRAILNYAASVWSPMADTLAETSAVPDRGP